MIEQNPTWSFAIVGLVVFFESLVIVGVLVPGWLILVAVGALVGSGVLPLYSVLLAMIVGAILGEGLSYVIGRYFRHDIRHWSWFERHHSVLERSDNFIKRYGVLSLVVGRFIGPIRAILPTVAGISGMPRRVFWAVNIGSALLWAPLYLFPGILAGAALELPNDAKEIVAVATIAIILFAFLARHWWVTNKKNYSYLAMMISLTSFIAILSHPVGEQLFKLLGTVFLL
jgi:undecaprenyl-diphosphatase